MSVFWNARQSQQIKKTKVALQDAASQVRIGHATTQSQIAEMANQIKHLTNVQQAMWELLVERTGATDEQLNRKYNEVIARDARAVYQAVECPCGAKMAAHALSCDFCGRSRG